MYVWDCFLNYFKFRPLKYENGKLVDPKTPKPQNPKTPKNTPLNLIRSVIITYQKNVEH